MIQETLLEIYAAFENTFCGNIFHFLVFRRFRRGYQTKIQIFVKFGIQESRELRISFLKGRPTLNCAIIRG